jgi:hypothetical protein
MERKTSTLTTGLLMMVVGSGFVGIAGALGSLAVRVRKLERKVDGDGKDS